MNNISALAHVNPNAKIGENVIIEPFAYIDANTEIGNNTHIMAGAQVRNGARIGKHCTLYPGCVISADPQDLKYKGEDTTAIIGDYTTIRECVTVNKGTAAKMKTVVGSHCLLMAYSHVAHDCIIKDHVILGNTTQLAGEVEIDDYAILSGATLVHQFTRIGCHVILQGGSRVGKDIPPYITAGREPLGYAGVNLIGLRRRGFTNEQINNIQEVYRAIYQSGYNFSDAINFIEKNIEPSPERDLIVNFVKSSNRGIVRGLV